MKANLSCLVDENGAATFSKRGLRRIAHKMGIEVYTLQHLPFGLNHLLDAIRKGELTNPDVIFDVGANIGQTSTYLRKAFPKSEIYAFEPVRSTYRELQKNVSDQRVKTFNIGLGDRGEKLKVYLQKESGLNSLVESLNKPNGSQVSEDAEITTIDNFCLENHIDKISLLKIDTEGFGLKVLKGAETLLKNGRVESVFIEVGFDYHDKRHDHFCKVYETLSAFSFKLFGFYNQWIEKSRLEYCNALFVLNQNVH